MVKCNLRVAQHRMSRSGFTLLELLVAISIIALLIALLVPVLGNARTRAQEGRVRAELSALEQGIADFKTTFGSEPPSHIRLYERAGDAGMMVQGWAYDGAPGSPDDQERIRSRALIMQLWPSFDFNYTATMGNLDIDRDDNVDSNADTEVHDLDGAHCLVFFLGGPADKHIAGNAFPGLPHGFSKDPASPFLRGGARLGPFYEFVHDRLFFTPSIDPNTQLPVYRDSLQSSETAPIVYYSSYNGTGYNFGDNSEYMTRPYFSTTDYSSPWKQTSFQLISPGVDGVHGFGGVFTADTASSTLVDEVTSMVDSDFNTLLENRLREMDNITNLQAGRLLP